MIRFKLVLILFLVCKISFSQTEDLGELYSIGINFRLNHLQAKKVFVADTVTDNEFSMSTRECTMVFERFFYNRDSLGTSTYYGIDSIKNRDIKNIFARYNYVTLISSKAKNKLFKQGISEGWSNFYELHPTYAGIIFLSPVYFNQQHTKAVYQLSLATQGCANGRNSLVFLEKDSTGKWFKTRPGK